MHAKNQSILIRLKKNFFILLIICGSFSLCIMAGFWQLERAKLKRLWQQDFLTAKNKTPLLINEIKIDFQRKFDRVSIVGDIQPMIFLLDNQLFKGQFGYEVIQLARLDSAQYIFISRGWIKGNLRREILPTTEILQGKINLTGYLYPITDNPWIKQVALDGKTQVIAKLNKEVAEVLGFSPIADFVLRVEQPENQIYTPHWQINFDQNKHYSYAGQWFLIALLLLGYGYWQLRKSNE